ncbi:MAG: transposase IS200-family protein [Chthonomonadaceae bacterium]|nr:transposase IS200-family protein [Chthonomonadaceae bacterium]
MPQVQNRALLHFVWATYDRMPWVTADIAASVYRYITTVAIDDGCEVLAIGGMPDHVHLLVRMSTTVSIRELMMHVKGGSSRLIQRDFAPGSFFRWQGSYGVYSVSPSHRKRVVAYIQNQERHHREDSLWPDAEQTSQEQDASG